jgi:hypothetical protein
VPQLDLFLEKLPRRTWATDTLGAMRIVERAEAATKAYVAPNTRWEKRWLVFDLDRPTASFDWQDREIPAPNLTAMNRENGHAHVFYGLALPLHADKPGAALRYGAAVETALREALEGDISYGGPLAKNPLHDRWIVQEWQREPYTLDWLADYRGIDLTRYQDGRRALPAYGLGRNVTVFTSLRLWSYRHVLAAKSGPFSAWLDECTERAKHYNGQFPAPLGALEVRGIAKSVARWTWEHFSYHDFSAIQRARVAKRWGNQVQERRQLLLGLMDALPAASGRHIARVANIPESTVRRLRKGAANTISGLASVRIPYRD